MHPLLVALRARGWSVHERGISTALLPPALLLRYPSLPVELCSLLSAVSRCQNANGNAWLLTSDDYWRPPGIGFAWNELSLSRFGGQWSYAALDIKSKRSSYSMGLT